MTMIFYAESIWFQWIEAYFAISLLIIDNNIILPERARRYSMCMAQLPY